MAVLVGSVANLPALAGCGIVGARVILYGVSAHKMRVLLKPGRLILCPESETERSDFAAWGASLPGHVFLLENISDHGASLHDIGNREDACRDPINITFDTTDPRWQLISNLAFTPFVMDDLSYASVEGFWQGLKFETDEDRTRIAKLWGKDAKRAAGNHPERNQFIYKNQNYATGSTDHRALMKKACEAKFTQHALAREALLASRDRPLMHRVRRDSKTVPGALMADIWMRIREKLRLKEQ